MRYFIHSLRSIGHLYTHYIIHLSIPSLTQDVSDKDLKRVIRQWIGFKPDPEVNIKYNGCSSFLDDPVHIKSGPTPITDNPHTLIISGISSVKRTV